MGGVTTPQAIPNQPSANQASGQSTPLSQTTASLFPLSPYNPSAAYKAQMQTKVERVAPANGQSAGFAGYSPELARNGVQPEGRGYCTDYARRIYTEVTGKSLPFYGNAGTWYAKAQGQSGIRTLPASDIRAVPPGAIAVWEGTTNNTQSGHVAIVKENTGTTIKFSEANWGPLDPQYSDKTITKNFNTVTESPDGYTYGSAMSHANPVTGQANGYRLVGFILP
jgi:surface antigen